jgi:hypothetical protein
MCLRRFRRCFHHFSLVLAGTTIIGISHTAAETAKEQEESEHVEQQGEAQEALRVAVQRNKRKANT